MIQASDLIALWRRALDEGWGYIWGTAGETWTQAKQDKATRAQTIKWGSKWIGKRVADGSQQLSDQAAVSGMQVEAVFPGTFPG